MRRAQPCKPPATANRLSRPRRLAAILAALVAVAGASLAAAPIATATPTDVPVTIATTTPPRPPAPPPGGPRNPDGSPFQPCKPVFSCVELARQVCRALGGCKTPSERWRAQPRNAKLFAQRTAADGEPRPQQQAELWQLHHIVPIGDHHAYVAQSIAFRVGIRPNDGVNGVWLRGPELRKGTPGYAALTRAQRRRIYHGVFSGRPNRAHYAQVVNRRLLSACPGQRCTRARVDGALRGIRRDLINGNAAFYRPGVPRR